MSNEMREVAQQIAKIIREKRNILIITHQKMDCDALSSTLALYLILQKMGKTVTAICQDPVPDAFRFLPDTEVMNTKFSETSDFIITLDTKHSKMNSLKWNVEDNKVNIIISPEGKGSFSRQDLTFRGGSGKDFDLIIACDAADIQQLGLIYEQNAELFHAAPMVVIDHHASNPAFGTINYIVPTNASTTETIYDLLPEITGSNYDLVDEDIATLLLAGIITDTGSFQHPNTTPKSFEVAANLIDMGARQQEIIKYLFKTKKLTTLRLWGKVLAKIKYDPVHRFVWSTVSKNDLMDEHANSDETEGLIDELMSNAPGVEVVLLLKEREDGVVSGSVRTTTPLCDGSAIAGLFGGGGHRQAAGFKIRNPRSFEEVIAHVIPKIEEFQEKRLGITSLKKEENSALPEKISDFERKTEFPVVPEETQTLPEKKTDFEPIIPALKKAEKLLSEQQKLSTPPKSDVKIKKEEKDEEIPDWLSEKPKKEQMQDSKEESEEVIPDWLEKKAEQKTPKSQPQVARVEDITPAAEGFKPEKFVTPPVQADKPQKKPDQNSRKEDQQKQNANQRQQNGNLKAGNQNGNRNNQQQQNNQKNQSTIQKKNEQQTPKQNTPVAPPPPQRSIPVPAPASVISSPAGPNVKPLVQTQPSIPPVKTALAPVLPVASKEVPAPIPTTPPPPPKPILEPRKSEPPKSAPLSGILDPNPPADLIPQMPKAPPPRPQFPPAPQNYGAMPPMPGGGYNPPLPPAQGGYTGQQFSPPPGYGQQQGASGWGPPPGQAGGYNPPPPPPPGGYAGQQYGPPTGYGQQTGGGWNPPPPLPPQGYPQTPPPGNPFPGNYPPPPPGPGYPPPPPPQF